MNDKQNKNWKNNQLTYIFPASDQTDCLAYNIIFSNFRANSWKFLLRYFKKGDNNNRLTPLGYMEIVFWLMVSPISGTAE